MIRLLSILSIALVISCQSREPSRVLLIGDSVAGGYYPVVKQLLQGKAIVQMPKQLDADGKPTSCEGTTMGVAHVDDWIGQTSWDVIHFNFGLHDMKHIDPLTGKNSKNLTHPLQASLDQYRANLNRIVAKLKQTGATLIFATTTPYPDKLGKQIRSPGMPKVYNEVATDLMEQHGILVNDLYSHVLPSLDVLQKPNNVHFLDTGSVALGRQVAASIFESIEYQL